ncbi:hypothetical protein GMDG_01282 [Pseudogymnoascus destructans 20631-21]|uniref:Uncharacterized protein n=1 Tax=Pseudogymnoascus destructans (strain ATCC MYA-4855 / 20631-21) TaxID=658429 RepID=L8FUW2_PSED2|nr:hypothetical protein GMDG_01282 [Pseudogymnoascus destructans 20631-21]
MRSRLGDGISQKTTSAVFAKSTLTALVQPANTQEMIAVYCPGNAVTTSTCIASSNGSSKTPRRASVQCADKNSNGLKPSQPTTKKREQTLPQHNYSYPTIRSMKREL